MLKNYLKKFKNIHLILRIIKNLFLRRDFIRFNGLGMLLLNNISLEKKKNKISLEFEFINNDLLILIKNREFRLLQIEELHQNNFEFVLDNFNELIFRHYYVFYSACLAYNNTLNRNLVECGVGGGMSAFFAMSCFNKSKNAKFYLYDSFGVVRPHDIKEVSEKNRIGNYDYLDAAIIKNNLNKFNSKIIYNVGYLPETLFSNNHPDKISWLHVDLDNSYTTKEVLNFFYPRLVKNGIILINSYGIVGHEKTMDVCEEFFKELAADVLLLPTGQAMVVKK